MSLLRAAYVACLFGTLTFTLPAMAATTTTDVTDLRASGGGCGGSENDEALALSFAVGCTALARRPRR